MTYAPHTWVNGECLTAALLNAMEAGIDRAQGDVMKLYGPTAGLPASDPLLVGRLYMESDLLNRWWRDNGAGWDLVFTGGAAAGNGLLNNLVAYWPGNEVNGNALDLHTNALHLTDTNTVTSNPGLVYPLARQYTRVNSEYHRRPGDDALLSVGDTDFTLAAWIYMDSKPAAIMAIATKDNISATGREYSMRWLNTTDRLGLTLFDGTNVIVTATASTLGAPAITTWYLLVAWHDSVANTLNIQVNDGVVDSYATGGTAPGDTGQPFHIGAYSGPLYYWNGRTGPTMFWKSAAGGGGVLTAAQRTALYNGGAGLTYAAFTV